MRQFFTLLFVIALLPNVQGQSVAIKIDSTMPFMSDPAKKYSIYLPAGYTSTGSPYKAFVCMHPFNTSRWDAQSWRDTLCRFAETNGLILICPDGGVDGDITDPIDTAFTSTLLDSALSWYNIRTDRIFLMGFSMGGLATYTYGLNNIRRFKGLLAVGAVNNYAMEFDAMKHKADEKPIFIMHGTLDNPAVRYQPAKDTLIKYGGCVGLNFISGVGHTFDFVNRNEFLKDAYVYLDTTVCVPDTSETGIADLPDLNFSIAPNPVIGGENLKLITDAKIIDQAFLFSLSGELLRVWPSPISNTLVVPSIAAGTYLLELRDTEGARGRQVLQVLH